MTTKTIHDPDVQAYLKELAADIAAHGGLEGKTMEQAVKEAHRRREAFAAEMIEGATVRAKMARKAICTSILIEATNRLVRERLMMDCEWVRAGRE